jgi:hypothetical protein
MKNTSSLLYINRHESIIMVIVQFTSNQREMFLPVTT